MRQYTLIKTPIGPVGIVASPAGLSHVYLMRGASPDAERKLKRLHPDAVRDDGLMPELRRELGSYLSGRPVGFTAPVDLAACTQFQRRVLRACAKVGYGQTVSYGELARRVGCPAGARAVGGALARNPVPLVIPCHRVVAGNGTLGGFSAEHGVKLKQALLEMESTTDQAALPRAARRPARVAVSGGADANQEAPCVYGAPSLGGQPRGNRPYTLR
jgi:methylated-DNA-[protein]-cysteine S-methyltransferase